MQGFSCAKVLTGNSAACLDSTPWFDMATVYCELEWRSQCWTNNVNTAGLKLLSLNRQAGPCLASGNLQDKQQYFCTNMESDIVRFVL